MIVVEKVEKPTSGPLGTTYAPTPSPIRPTPTRCARCPTSTARVVVMDPQTGRVLAMSGGWSYGMSQFNRAVQAQRQPGSSFKPFVYLAAMDSGLTPSTIVEDAPFEYDPGYGQPIWRPATTAAASSGPLTVRNGLEKSRNLMTVRMAQQIGMKRVVQVAKEFGISDNMGAYLPMALGAVDTTLLRMTMGHAMLANGAREITPSLIDRVQDRNGKTVYRHEPRDCIGCGEAPPGQKPPPPEIVDNRQPFHDPGERLPGHQHDAGRDRARHRGPARRRARAGRSPARPARPTTAATTGSSARRPTYTIGIYVGFDEPRTLGEQETGGGTSAPIYERIAHVVFKDKPPMPFRIPPGLRIVRVDHDSGLPSSGGRTRSTRPSSPAPSPTNTAPRARRRPAQARRSRATSRGMPAADGVPPAALAAAIQRRATGGGGGRRPTLSGTGGAPRHAARRHGVPLAHGLELNLLLQASPRRRDAAVSFPLSFGVNGRQAKAARSTAWSPPRVPPPLGHCPAPLRGKATNVCRPLEGQLQAEFFDIAVRQRWTAARSHVPRRRRSRPGSSRSPKASLRCSGSPPGGQRQILRFLLPGDVCG